MTLTCSDIAEEDYVSSRREVTSRAAGRVFRILVAGFIMSFVCGGCATVPKRVQDPKKAAQVKGVHHKVSKGETLWRIAKTYRVSVDEVTQANNIPNAASIEENQLLFIPGADAVCHVPLPQPGKDSEFAWPVQGKVISYFEERKGAHVSPGINIEVEPGQPVMASRGGRVVFADYLGGYGYTAIVDHADGFFSVYGHNERLIAGLGDYVFKGEKIAQAGTYSHFEIRKGEEPSNPLFYLP